MKKLLIILLYLSVSVCYSQEYLLPKKLLNPFLLDTNKIDECVLKTELGDDGFYIIKLIYKTKEESFKLKPLTNAVFESKMKSSIVSLLSKASNYKAKPVELVSKATVIKNEIALLFAKVASYHNSEESQPVVATIELRDSIPFYYTSNKLKQRIDKGIRKRIYEIESNKKSLAAEGKKVLLEGGTHDCSKHAAKEECSIKTALKLHEELRELNSIQSNLLSTDKIKLGTLGNVKVELSFYDGFIEKIQVHGIISTKQSDGTVKKQSINFNNTYSIGISSNGNIKDLDTYNLYSNDKINVDLLIELIKSKVSFDPFNSTENLISELKLKRSNYIVVNVGEVIRYIRKVDINANDLSPIPTLMILDKDHTNSELHKEWSSRLFEMNIFTDLYGLFEDDSPNGVVQTEINKRFNINTKRSDGWLPMKKLIEGYGFFQYFDANFQYSKIEGNKKFYIEESYPVFDSLDIQQGMENYYSPLNLFRFRNYSIGGMLNILAVENQNAKYLMHFNAGFHFGRTGIKTLEDDEDGVFVNNLEIPIELGVQLIPEKRFSFSVTDRLSWFETFDANINMKSIEDNRLSSKNRFINSINLGLKLDISESGKLFVRYIFTHELDNIDNNYSRLQFGHSFYILKNNGVKNRIKK